MLANISNKANGAASAPAQVISGTFTRTQVLKDRKQNV